MEGAKTKQEGHFSLPSTLTATTHAGNMHGGADPPRHAIHRSRSIRTMRCVVSGMLQCHLNGCKLLQLRFHHRTHSMIYLFLRKRIPLNIEAVLVMTG